jgi:hypothetical protein
MKTYLWATLKLMPILIIGSTIVTYQKTENTIIDQFLEISEYFYRKTEIVYLMKAYSSELKLQNSFF